VELFVDGTLNPLAFAADVRHATGDLTECVRAAERTRSPKIESTHFLMVLSNVANGSTQKGLARMGLSVEQWQSGLANCAARTASPAMLRHLTRDAFHPSALAMLKAAEEEREQRGAPAISEPALLLAALRNVTPAVGALCRSAEVDVTKWADAIEKCELADATAVRVYDARGVLDTRAFSPGARKVLRLMQREAESLGYKDADLRHLLLALLEYEAGAMHYGLLQQGLVPRKAHEAVMLNLRAKASRTPTAVPMDVAHHQPLLRITLEKAGELAGRDQCARVLESHLLRAFLDTESAALRLLLDEPQARNVARQRATAETFDATGDEDADDATMADIETVRHRLLDRLVGQNDAIERILPYVQRMRFGFRTPGRPVGVFLFCGQSGSGKTEMAKELARAVYGSEDSLIFLEMGQFNAPESMNIFVGAPPGYVGYGEGKLTNGLRDRPRAVILFDEVEKAHAKVLDALLRFLDDGKIGDPAGPVRDGSQCIVVLTSNLAADEMSKVWKEVQDNPNWRAVVRARLREAFRKENFRQEFLNRVDEIILFRTLDVEDYTEIARRLLARDTARLSDEWGIHVSADTVTKAIGTYCHSISEGARAAQRLTQSVVITPVIDFVLRHKCVPPVHLVVTATQTTSDPASEPVGAVRLA